MVEITIAIEAWDSTQKLLLSCKNAVKHAITSAIVVKEASFDNGGFNMRIESDSIIGSTIYFNCKVALLPRYRLGSLYDADGETTFSDFIGGYGPTSWSISGTVGRPI